MYDSPSANYGIPVQFYCKGECTHEWHERLMNSDFLIVKAKFTLYPTDEGGRKTPIVSGYRPDHVFEYKENSDDLIMAYVGDVNFEGQESLSPGESVMATIRFLRHGDIERFMQIGRVWWIHEARNRIGEAEIITI